MSSIRKFQPKKEVIETSIKGFYIKALTIKESKEIVDSQTGLTAEQLMDEEFAKKLTMKLFSLACDENGEAFDEFETYEKIEELSIEEFNMFADAIKEALIPGAASEKK